MIPDLKENNAKLTENCQCNHGSFVVPAAALERNKERSDGEITIEPTVLRSFICRAARYDRRGNIQQTRKV